MKKLVIFSIIFALYGLVSPKVGLAAPHGAGVNIQSQGTVYMITSDSQRRPYTSAGAFLSYGFNSWSDVQTATTEDLALPVGSFIPPRDGKVLCSDRGTDKNTCYLISKSKKAAFTSEKVFKDLGFNFTKAIYGDVSFLSDDSLISSSTEQHRAGTLVNKNGTIYLISSIGLLGIPSPAVLESWGYSFADTIISNLADSQLTQQSVIQYRNSGELNPQGQTPNPVPPAQPTDVCTNIEGTQTTVPAGMVVDLNGICTTPTSNPPPVVTPNANIAISVTSPTNNASSGFSFNVTANITGQNLTNNYLYTRILDGTGGSSYTTITGSTINFVLDTTIYSVGQHTFQIKLYTPSQVLLASSNVITLNFLTPNYGTVSASLTSNSPTTVTRSNVDTTLGIVDINTTGPTFSQAYAIVGAQIMHNGDLNEINNLYFRTVSSSGSTGGSPAFTNTQNPSVSMYQLLQNGQTYLTLYGYVHESAVIGSSHSFIIKITVQNVHTGISQTLDIPSNLITIVAQ